MKKECPIVLVQVEDGMEIPVGSITLHYNELGNPGRLYISNVHGEKETLKANKRQHLYVLSDEKIDEGDWMYIKEDNGKIWIERCPKFLGIQYVDKKKIIATTNPELCRQNYLAEGMTETNYIPAISPLHIEFYILAYNKGNNIKFWMVEYEEKWYCQNGMQCNCSPDSHKTCYASYFQPALNNGFVVMESAYNQIEEDWADFWNFKMINGISRTEEVYNPPTKKS